MITEHQIRDELLAFLQSAISLDEFEDWLAQESWNMHRDSAPPARELAAAIELALAEHSSGHLAWYELRARLLSLGSTIVVDVPVMPEVYAVSAPVTAPAGPFVLADLELVAL